MTASNEKTPRLAQWTGFTTERGTAQSRDDLVPKRAEDEVNSFINMHKHSRAPQPVDCEDEDDEQVEARYNAIAQRIEALSDEKFDLIAQKRRECFRNKLLASTPNFDACPREESEELLDAEHMLKEVLDSSSRFQGMMGLSAMPENFQSDASLSNLELVPHRFSNQFYEVSETERREVELIHQSERGTWGKSAKPDQFCKEAPHDNSYESEYENFRLILRDNPSQVPHQVLRPSKESKNLSPALQGSEVFTGNIVDKGSDHSTTTPTQKSLVFQAQTGNGLKAMTKLSKAHLLQESAELSPQEAKGDTNNTIQGCSTQELSKNSSQNAHEANNASSGSRDTRAAPGSQEESGSSVHREGAKNTSISRDQTRMRHNTHSAAESPSPGHSKPSPVEETATFAKATHPNTEMNISFEGQEACQSPEPLASSRREGLKKTSPSEEEETPRMQPAMIRMLDVCWNPGTHCTAKKFLLG